MKLTQKEKVLKALRDANGGKVSGWYLKHVLYISECNGRISDLKNDGYTIVTEGYDEHGFAYHRLLGEPQRTRTITKVEVIDGKAYARQVEVPLTN